MELACESGDLEAFHKAFDAWSQPITLNDWRDCIITCLMHKHKSMATALVTLCLQKFNVGVAAMSNAIDAVFKDHIVCEDCSRNKCSKTHDPKIIKWRKILISRIPNHPNPQNSPTPLRRSARLAQKNAK
jgi:hypothetical protein